MTETSRTINMVSTPDRAQTLPRPLKPMALWRSLLLFGVPAIIAAVDLHVLWPWLVRLGMSEEVGYHYAHSIWFVALLVAALAAYALEGNPLNWRSFAVRYRLGPMRWREWRWMFGGILLFIPLAYGTTILASAV